MIVASIFIGFAIAIFIRALILVNKKEESDSYEYRVLLDEWEDDFIEYDFIEYD